MIRDGVLQIPDEVQIIEDGAFFNNKMLKRADLRNVKYIGARAFQDCSNLESVVMNRATVIRPMAFEFCKSLTTIELGEVSEIGEAAFSHCDKLDISEFPASLKSVGRGAFAHTRTKRADLPRLAEIPPYLFYGCTSLEYADIGSAKVIGDMAFAVCESLERVRLDAAEVIGAHAFSRCDRLIFSRLPNNLKSLGEDALARIRDGLAIPPCIEYLGFNCLGPADIRKSIQIRRSSLYVLRDYFLNPYQNSTLEDEHFYMHESSIDVTVVDDATGKVIGFLPLYADIDGELRAAICSAFRPDNTFDYSVLDRELFYKMRWNQRGKDRLAVLRTKHPYDLTQSAADQYSDYLTKHSVRIAERAVKAEDVEMLTFLYEHELIRSEDITGILDLAISQSAHDCTAFLLKCQSELSGYEDDLFDDL